MSSPASPVRTLRRRLGRLRRRIRALFALQGLARWLLAAIVALLLFFLADWLLDLPLGVRRFVRLGLLDRPPDLAQGAWIVLLGVGVWLTIWATKRRLGAAPVFAFGTGGIVGVLVWLGARVLSPLGASLSDESLALSVEQRYRRLNDRLAAALDFEEELQHPSRGESEAMMRVVLDEAAEEAKGLEFARAISGRRALGWVGAALAAIVVAAGIAFAAPATVDLWAKRSLLLEDVSWPRATTLLAVDLDAEGVATPHDPARPFEVSVGRPLLVYAQAQGRVPDEILLLDRVEGARPLPRRMFAVPDRAGLFRVEVRDVRRAFEFVLQGGDDTDEVPRYRVEVTVPPRVLEITADLAYPAYLARAEETIEGGNLEVPEGTTVRIAFRSDVPVANARAALRDEVLPAEAIGADGRSFTFSFVASESVRYRILLETPEGRTSDPAADTYEVRVRSDRPPRLRWIFPRGSVESTPRGRVPILAVATDDHAIQGLTLEIQRADGTTQAVALVPHETSGAEERDEAEDDGEEGDDAGALARALDGPYGRAEVRAYLPMEVEAVTDAEGRAPNAPARLAIRLIAKDSKGQAKEGTWTPIDVYGPVDVERTLSGRRSAVRSELAAILAEQRGRRAQLADLVELAGAGGELKDAERDLLKSIQFAQAKIAQDTDAAVRRLTEIFNTWVYGRLGADNPTERILAILDRYQRKTYGREPNPSEVVGQPGDPAFPYAVYDEIVAARDDRTIFDTGLLDRMLAVLDDAVDAAARKTPAAHAAASGAVGGSVPLTDALAAQDAVLGSLERILAAVQSWQSLNDVILQLRRVIEEQEALDERLQDDVR